MQVKDLTDGRYLISFTPEESGEYVVSALVNGDEIPPDQELQANVLTPPLTVDMCALYVPDQAKVVPAGSSFYVTVGPPETCESKPEDGAKCLVHLQDPKNGITLFPAPWDAQQVAFVADVFVGVVGGNILWATVDVRDLPAWPCAACVGRFQLSVDDWRAWATRAEWAVCCIGGSQCDLFHDDLPPTLRQVHVSWRSIWSGRCELCKYCSCMSGSRATR